MDVTRVTAKTLDEAITKAAIDLGTSSDNLEYTVEEQKSGFLGLGKSVTIKAYKKSESDLEELYAEVVKGGESKKKEPKAAAEPVKDIPRQQPAKDYVKPVPRNEFKDQKKEGQGQKKEAKKEKADNRREIKTEFKTESKYEVKSEIKIKEKTPPKPEKELPKKEQKPVQKQAQKPNQNQGQSQRNPYRESGRENRESRESIEAEREALRLAEEKRAEKERDRKENKKPSDIEACKTAAGDFLKQVFAAMGMNVEVDTVYDEEEVELIVNLAGDDMGILIGKRGQTLDSLQYLTSLVVNRKTDGYLRVKLDTENYRARRKETLEVLAKNIAYKVRRTRHSVSLEPMNPYERRIIHAALQNDTYVVTRSEGEDPYRHVVVSLKREAYREQRDRKGGSGGYGKRSGRNYQGGSGQAAGQEVQGQAGQDQESSDARRSPDGQKGQIDQKGSDEQRQSSLDGSLNNLNEQRGQFGQEGSDEQLERSE